MNKIRFFADTFLTSISYIICMLQIKKKQIILIYFGKTNAHIN